MKHYIGITKVSVNNMTHFTSDKKPTKQTYWYFDKVLGPYDSEMEAKDAMGVLKRGYKYVENPVCEKGIKYRGIRL